MNMRNYIILLFLIFILTTQSFISNAGQFFISTNNSLSLNSMFDDDKNLSDLIMSNAFSEIFELRDIRKFSAIVKYLYLLSQKTNKQSRFFEFVKHDKFKNKVQEFIRRIVASNDWQEIRAIIEFFYFVSINIPFEDMCYIRLINFWDSFVAFFGVDAPVEKKRFEELQLIFENLITNSDVLQKQIFLDFKIAFPRFSYQATGTQRFVPLGIAILNILRGENLLTTDGLTFDMDLLRNHLFYNPRASFGDISYEHVEVLSSLLEFDEPFPTPHKKDKAYTFLDIGSAPKLKGAPTLNILKQMLDAAGYKTDMYGTDIVFPHWRFDHDSRQFVEVFTDITVDKKDRQEVNGITYLDASVPVNDASSDLFMSDGRKFDFISVCKMIHHFRTREKAERVLLSEFIRTSSGKKKKIKWQVYRRGKIFNRWRTAKGEQRPYYVLNPIQKKVVGNLCNALNIGGYLFLELSLYGNIRPDDQKNDDMFLIIRREDETTFRIYEQTVPYMTEDEKPYPADASLSNRMLFFDRAHDSLQDAYHLTDEENARLVKVLRRADMLVFRYQKRDHSTRRYLRLAETAIRNKEPLKKIFEIYLRGVVEILDDRDIAISKKEREKISAEISNILDEIEKISTARQQAISPFIDNLSYLLQGVKIFSEMFYDQIFDFYLRVIRDKKTKNVIFNIKDLQILNFAV